METIMKYNKSHTKLVSLIQSEQNTDNIKLLCEAPYQITKFNSLRSGDIYMI